MTVVPVELDEDIFSILRRSPREVAEEMRRAAAIVWYARGMISQGMGAELARLSRTEFIDALSASGVSPIQESVEEIREALRRE